MKMPKILFFIAGMAPTPEEAEAAIDIGAVAMRNRSAIMPTDNPEKADAVASADGVIPEPYKDYPVVKSLADAIKIVRDKAKAEANFSAETLKANAAGAAFPAGNPNGADLTGAPGQGAPSGKETPPRAGLGGAGDNGGQPAGGGTTPITQQKAGNAPGWKKNA
jgi:hypothetical protein